MRCSKNRPCELRGSKIPWARFGKKSSSPCFARATKGTLPRRPTSSNTATARASWPLPPQGRQRFGCIFGGHLDQGALLPAVRDANPPPAIAAPLAQPLADDLCFFHLMGQQDFGRHISCLVVILLDKLSQHVRIG